MTILQILQRIDEEKSFGSRFPARIIFVQQLHQYKELVFRLSSTCHTVLKLSEFCSADDVYPNFRSLQKKISELKDKQILLLSVGEYLRLSIKRELQPERSQFSSLWQSQQESTSKTRIIIPLFACKDLFERIVPIVDERQQEYIWEVDPEISSFRSYSVSVYSMQFNDALDKANTILGIKEWLEKWEKEIENERCSVLTSLHSNAENITGIVSVRVVDDPFDYITSIITDGNKLKMEWGTDNQWSSIVRDVVKNSEFNKTIENALNLKTFDPINVLAMWDILTEKQKWIVWIWYRINYADDYFGYVFRNAQSFSNIKRDMYNAIFRVVSDRPEWIAQRMQALEALKIDSFDEAYFEQLDKLAMPESKLNLLTYKTHEERAFAIKTVSQWLRKGVDMEVVIELLSIKFPLFAIYLGSDYGLPTPELKSYFRWYRYCKIKNQYPQPGCSGIPQVNLEPYISRYIKLKQYSEKDCIVLWIDCMGIEWLPLLIQCIKMQKLPASITVDIVSAVLPTETCYNEQWNDFNFPCEKWNKLDVLAHKGMPDDKDYYSCIDYQLSVISDAANKVSDLLNKHDYVIMTSDHGSSRLAALSFHNTIGIAPPKGAVVRSYGRFCELSGPPSLTDMLPCTRYKKNNGKEYLIMTTHEHYAQSGNAAAGNSNENAVVGEVHGGMTPEEYLVPFIVLKRNIPLLPLDYSLNSTTVFRDKGRVEISLHFSRPISSLEVMAESIRGVCTQTGENTWMVTFSNMDTREYTIDVIANGRLLNRHDSFIVKAKGISRNDDLFGGL